MKTNIAHNTSQHRLFAHNAKVRRVSAVCCAALLIALSLPGCARIKEAYSKKKDGPAAPVQEATVYAVNTTTAVQGQIRDYIPLSGDIVAGSTVDVYSDAAGKVAEVYVAVGQRVGRGERVAAVDPSKPGMTYHWGIATAPITGTVVALPAQVGMTISQAVPLARISGGSGSGAALEIKLYVAERFISKMAMNLPCEITLDAWPGEVFQGSISEVAPTVDPASRTMEIRVNVNNTGNKLKAGMFAKVRIITEQKTNIVKIPSSALISRFGEQYVFIVDKTDAAAPVARKKTITPGILIDGVLEIQQGLAPNDEIVIRGQSLLEDGSRINIVEQTAPLGAN
jgi:multidrug efflux pump subunit AcrA (membrane-fusion protein)